MKLSREILAASVICLFSIAALVCLLSVADTGSFLHLADQLASTGRAGAFARKDIVNLRRTLLLASSLGCMLALRIYFNRPVLHSRGRRFVSTVEAFLPDARPRRWGAVAVIVAAASLVYIPCLRFAFLGEDFQFIMWGLQDIRDIFAPVPNWQHYKPIGLILTGLPARLFGVSEFVYHAHIVMLHVINCLILFFFIEYLTAKRGLAFTSALIYALFSMQYEAVFWGEAQYYQFSTMFSLLSIWLFVLYLRRGRAWLYAAFLAMYAVNILTYEQGIAALGICFFYEMLVGPRLPGGVDGNGLLMQYARIGKKYVLPLCFVLALWAFKTFIVGKTGIYVTSPLKIVRFYVANLMSFTTPGFFLGLAAGTRIAQNPPALLTALAGLLLLGWFLYKKNRFQLFLLTWILVAMLPNSFFGTLSSRNFPMPAIGFAMLLASLVGWIGYRLAEFFLDGKQPPAAGETRALAGWIAATIIILVLFANVLSLRDRQEGWLRASELAYKLTRQCVEIAVGFGPEKEIHFVGRPLGVATGAFWTPPHPFGMYFNGEIAYRSGRPEETIFDHPAPGYLTAERKRALANDPDAVVFVYDRDTEEFKRVDD